MRRRARSSHHLCGALVLIVLASFAAATEVTWAQDEAEQALERRLTRARALSNEFAGQLRAALDRALADGGAVAAIAVCRSEAPRIAMRLSAESGATVSRTSLRVRNPNNAPEPWQRTALGTFERRIATGARPDELEHFETQADGGARYLKAIVMQPLCVACHGEGIAPEVRRAIDEHYPQDQATGFKPGDLRGAFSIVWPAAGTSSP